MKTLSKWLIRGLVAAVFLSGAVHAEDIDIFAGTTAVDTTLPNVVFVLDNTSNWSRNSQKWPGGLVQGQSEVRAIKLALADKIDLLNVGIMEYVTGGSSADTDAGFTRFNLQKLDAAAYVALSAQLDAIFGNINSPTEKRSSSNPYGYLPWDFYNYLGGFAHSKNGAGNTGGKADPAAYDPGQVHSNFLSPLEDADACSDTFMIFIGNNANGSVASDDSTNTAALKALYTGLGLTAPHALAGDSSGTALGMPEFACTPVTGPPVLITPAQVIPAVAAYCDPPVTVPGTSFLAQIARNLGVSAACYRTSEVAACTTAERARVGGPCNVSPTPPNAPLPTAGTCSCTTTNSAAGIPACSPTSGNPALRRSRYNVVGNIAAYSNPSTTTTQCYPAVPEQIIPAVYGPGEVSDVCATTGQVDTTTGKNYNFDDWALFLKKHGIPLTVTVDGSPVQQRVKVTSYVIDVFNAQQSAALSSVWFSAANAGNGRYFQAKNEQQLIDAINSAAADIIAVSSSFAAVSLPLSATNRARVDNQVYIGMFRPSLGKKPRWFGNLKRYQLALYNDIPGLADATLRQAAIPDDGNVKPCAQSFWTQDSGDYWESMLIDPSVESVCLQTGVELWSDLPDGDFLEKGGVAQKTRQFADGDARTLFTVNSGGTALRDLAASDATAMGGTTVFNYLRGEVAGTGEVMPDDGLRASIHGDVVHSRPLAIRYSADDVTLFYGVNDGFYRAVNPADGIERWALVAPEHYSKIQRLHDNTPLVQFTGAVEGGETPKDYFFDGSTGQLLLYDEANEISQAYIYPTQRRGGRMVYGLDVTDPEADPDLLWRVGCPSLTSDVGCTTGFSDIGQTWSTPVGGFAKGYVDGDGDAKQVVAFGGGFDDCLNADVAAYPSGCSSANGKGVYIVDATTGTLLKYLATNAPVISELSAIDINFDGTLDFFYAADVAGDLYRINLIDMVANDASDLDQGFTFAALAKDDWTIVKIGSVADNERRFYNAPAAGAFQGRVIVTLGSGDRERPLEINYPFSEEVQNRFYAFFDEPYKTFVATPIGDLEVDEATTVDLDGATMLAVVEDEDPESFSQEYDGWYMDLPDRGEQVANPSVIGGGRVFFNTFQPGGNSDSLCARPLGIGTGYDISLFGPEYTEGEEIDAPGIPIPPAIFTVLLPQGLPDCEGDLCPSPPEDQCLEESDDCRVVTLCVGCKDLSDLPEIIPDAPPIRRRVFFTEDIDRSEDPNG